MEAKFSQTVREFIIVIIGLISAYGMGYLLITKTFPSETVIFWDMEEVIFTEGDTLFKSKKHFLQTGERQDSTHSYSGKYSAKFSNDEEYGLDFPIYSIRGNEVIKVSIWRYRTDITAAPPEIVAATDQGFWVGMNAPHKKSASGWEKLSMESVLPDSTKGQDLKIYIWNPSKKPVYFDDMEITIRRPGWLF